MNSLAHQKAAAADMRKRLESFEESIKIQEALSKITFGILSPERQKEIRKSAKKMGMTPAEFLEAGTSILAMCHTMTGGKAENFMSFVEKVYKHS